MFNGSYDVAQICGNGHVVTSSLEDFPETGRKFCEKCGAPTLSECRNCSARIRGACRGVFSLSYDRPEFCGECGAPFPWTQTAIDEWHALTEMMENLSAEERKRLDSVIDDLVRDTPGTNRATLMLKSLAPKLGKEGWDAMKGVLVSVATAAAKQQLGI